MKNVFILSSIALMSIIAVGCGEKAKPTTPAETPAVNEAPPAQATETPEATPAATPEAGSAN